MTGFTLSDLPVWLACAFAVWLFVDFTFWARREGLFTKGRRTRFELVALYACIWGIPTATVFGSIALWKAIA